MSTEKQKTEKELNDQNQIIVNQAQEKFNNGKWNRAIQ